MSETTSTMPPTDKPWQSKPGNPLAAKTARLRVALMNSITEEDMQQIARKLIEQAKAGNMAAVRELFQRTLGDSFEGLDVADGHILNRIDSAAGAGRILDQRVRT